MAFSNKRIQKYLEHYRNLPSGVLLYQVSVHGRVFVTGNGSVQEITEENKEYASTLHLFINAGNQAHYLLGSPDTSDAYPNNATVKMGITESHQHFTPHAHGSEHYVKSEGFSGCLLYDHAKKKAFPVKLLPGSLIYIPEWVPHAFYNRSDIPLITLIANGGLGLKDKNYAVTREIAQERLKKMGSGDRDLEELVNILGSIEELFDATHPEKHMDAGEKIASKLYRVAEYFSMH